MLGGIISPGHATQVRSRNRARPMEIIPPKHRLAIARASVGESSWLTVDPWEITRRRTMDYLSVLEHVGELFASTWPSLSIKIIVLASPNRMLKLSPPDMLNKGFSCLTVCRPQETDRLVKQLGSRWKNVAFVVEDAAILSAELEKTHSPGVRAALLKGDSTKAASMREIESMVGPGIAKYVAKTKLCEKRSRRLKWSETDKQALHLAGGDDGGADRGYVNEPRRPGQRGADAPDPGRGGRQGKAT